jgi:hypothetical protein
MIFNQTFYILSNFLQNFDILKNNLIYVEATKVLQ